jgi:anti-anti-sigma factor
MSARPGDENEFDVTVAIDETGTVVSVCGEIDVATAPKLREALAQALARRPRNGVSQALVVDLSGVPFMDAMGLGVLAGAARRAHGDGRDIVLRDPTPQMLQVLQITRLLRVFRVEWSDGTVAVLDFSVAGSRTARRSPTGQGGMPPRALAGTPCGPAGRRRSRSRRPWRSRH